MMYPLNFKGVELIDLNKDFGIKDATTKHIPGADIRNNPDMEDSSFTKAHRRSMTQLVW